MKAVVQDMKSGAMQVGEVPPPALKPGGILVRVRRSLISLGTERAVMALGKKGPLGKALDRPDLARKVLNKAAQEGYWGTYQVVRNLLAAPIPLGYSCAGEVMQVGEEASEFSVGERVACAGLAFANHAEVDYIPRNLAVKMPAALSYDSACFVAVGSVALQGTRLARLALGERVAVLGLGLVGQICMQLVRCAGGTVIAFDPDAGKHALARELGAHDVLGDEEALRRSVTELSDGQGADAVLVCAASSSSAPLQLAAALSRLKGRVVLIGQTGMKLERRAFFEKEIELVVSRSYGPGRYDPAYEERGIDYPYGYVRWTERRNMQAFLELLGREDARVEPLITHRFAIDEAERAYEIVSGKRKEPAIAIVLEYDTHEQAATRLELRPTSGEAPRAARGSLQSLRLGVIGAGNFAQGVLLPAFARQEGVRFEVFCTSSGFTSEAIARRYKAASCTSDPEEVIHDPNVDAVLIATRHDQHAPLALAALRAGKAVFVEKPLALDPDSLEVLRAFAREAGPPRLMVGFNRRFSPLAVACRRFFEGSREPLSVFYRVNAGQLPADSWVFDSVQGGGRIIGEGCHFIDMLCYLTGAWPRRVYAESLQAASEASVDRQSVQVSLRMSDGSVATLHYLSNGDPSLPKEYCEVFGGQKVAILENYRSLTLHCGNRRKRRRLMNQQKGFREEAAAFVGALRSGGPMPIDFETLVAVTRATFLVHESLDSGAAVQADPPETAVRVDPPER